MPLEIMAPNCHLACRVRPGLGEHVPSAFAGVGWYGGSGVGWSGVGWRWDGVGWGRLGQRPRYSSVLEVGHCGASDARAVVSKALLDLQTGCVASRCREPAPFAIFTKMHDATKLECTVPEAAAKAAPSSRSPHPSPSTPSLIPSTHPPPPSTLHTSTPGCLGLGLVGVGGWSGVGFKLKRFKGGGGRLG